MDRFEAMTLFVAVAEEGSLSAAGRAMNVPLATVSRKITDLETQLGTRLLTRTTRKLTLTDAGVGYVAAARRILEQVEQAEREAAGEFITPKGALVVTAPNMFGRLHVLPVVGEFLSNFPEINVRLILSDRNVDLIDDHVDMAVRIGKLSDSSMVATQIGMMRTITCASPALLGAYGVPKTPDDLTAFPCVTVETPMPSPSWRFQTAKTGVVLDVPILPRLTVTTPEAAAQAAVTGVGVTRLLHYQAFDNVKSGGLQIILEGFEPQPAPVNLVHVSRLQMPLKMRRFLDFALPHFRLRMSEIELRAKLG